MSVDLMLKEVIQKALEQLGVNVSTDRIVIERSKEKFMEITLPM